MKVSPVLFWLSTSILGLVLLGIGAEFAVRAQPAHPAPALGAFVTVQADERLFTLFAALNAAGYDDENFGEPFHPVRVTVRDYVAARPLPNLTRLRTQLNFIYPYAFVEWALHYGPPPDWTRVVDG